MQGEGEGGRVAAAAPVTQKGFWRMGVSWVVLQKLPSQSGCGRGGGLRPP